MSAEQFTESKKFLRREIPKLFENLPNTPVPAYEQRFAHPYSHYGALAVQRLAGGELRAVKADRIHRIFRFISPPQTHVVNVINGQSFDAFGLVRTQPAEKLQVVEDVEILNAYDGLAIRVESVLDPLRVQLNLPLEVLK